MIPFRQTPSRARQLYLLSLSLALITLFIPLNWVVVRRDFAGVYYEATSLIFHLIDIAVIILLLGFILNRQPQPAQTHKLTPALVALTILSAASITWALDLLLAAQFTLQLLILLALYFSLQWLDPPVKLIQFSLVAALILQAVVAISQFVVQDDLGLAWLGEISVDRYPGGGSIIAVGQEYWLRSYGLTNHPNILGGFLAMSCLLILGAALTNSRFGWLWWGSSALGAAALVLSFSRSAWFGFVVGFLFLAIVLLSRAEWRLQYRKALLWGGLALLIGGALAAWPVRALIFSRFSPAANRFETRSIEERGTLVGAALEAYRLEPLTGVGAGNGSVAVVPYVRDIPNVNPQPVHNVPILLLLEEGPAGALLWVWLMILPLVTTIRMVQKEPERVTPWLIALTAALIAFAVIDLYDYYGWGWAQGRYWRWLLWSFWALAAR